MIRSFKLAYQLYNVFQRRKLKHNIPLFKKYGIKKAYYSSLSSEDFKHLEQEKNYYDREDTAEHISKEVGFDKLPNSFQESLKSWSSNGYAILPGFLQEKEVDQINNDIENLIKNKDLKFKYNGRKIMFAHKTVESINALGTGERLTSILAMLMSKPVQLFQSINFIKGSEQRTHSDSIHMTSFPQGNLIAIWVALEDISMDNGPLHYYPGSHKMPYIMNADFGNVGNRLFLGKPSYSGYEDHVAEVIAKTNIEKEVFLAKKGDLLIWHANLLHGGNAMNNPELTRKSMVFHYYTKDAICFHEITQRPSFKE